jgi:hypothetical protein
MELGHSSLNIMFFTEFSPLFQEFVAQPIAFAGGFVSGLLRLNLADEPVKTWLTQQGSTIPTDTNHHHTNGNGPQNITID